jgi:uncharacterized MnhB-related membrane protein
MMLVFFLVLILLVFAIQALRARALITSALWLAGVSALTSLLLYLYGAHIVAVIELSVGAGLVTVLFVFAINIAGDDPLDARSILPWPWIAGLSALFVFLLGWFAWPRSLAPALLLSTEPAFSVVLWQMRGLDLLVQIALIFSGVLGLLGLLAESRPPLEGSMAAEVAAQRDLAMEPFDDEILQVEEVSK